MGIGGLRELRRMLWATAVCFTLGLVIGAAVLWGPARPFSGEGAVIIPIALVSAVVAAVAFAVSARMHRTGETDLMPTWQAVISHTSAAAVAVAIAGVTALAVLLAGEVLATGLKGLTLPAPVGGVFTGVASAFGGRLGFRLGIRLSTQDIATLLISFLVIGTLFAMLTATDPAWWERSFSDLGVGAGGWAFNGTLMIAGLLIATTGSYLGRDLHRLLGDPALPRIAGVVLTWAGAGVALTAVGLLPLDRVRAAHAVAAFSMLGLILLASLLTTSLLRDAAMLWWLTIVFMVLVAIAAFGTFGVRLLSVAALEGIVVGLVLLWLTTLVQVLCVLVPDGSRPSGRRSPLRG